MRVNTGYYNNPKVHHYGWFKYYKFKGLREIWFGKHWITIEWR